MQAIDQPFYTGLATRIFIFAIVVSSLNLILGYGGMVSFGHAAFLGSGAYTVGILSLEATKQIGLLPGTESAWIAWPAAAFTGGLLALVVGAFSLRTRGIYFIMITLAFAQMLYYIFVSLKMYGGDDGLNLTSRSQFGLGIDLDDDRHFYYVVLALCAATLFGMHRLVHSRFGRVIEGIRENEARMQAIGYATTRYKLVCFAIAGALAGLGGALLANQNLFVSPNMMSWFQSGSLLMMLIVGGVGRLWGGPIGALVFLVLEEVLSGYTQRWQFVMGTALIGIVLFAPRGIVGAFKRRGG
ncbi:branched-chain amino acid ABC transporter permease [Variovorax sp. J31P207]|nr:branched-chain amino acid ABC transporter permease [Variovorax sp. J31P207]MDM0066930.1 branched-chain amino acid ABC transporter permease [Variovorax sp. J31P207]